MRIRHGAKCMSSCTLTQRNVNNRLLLLLGQMGPPISLAVSPTVLSFPDISITVCPSLFPCSSWLAIVWPVESSSASLPLNRFRLKLREEDQTQSQWADQLKIRHEMTRARLWSLDYRIRR